MDIEKTIWPKNSDKNACEPKLQCRQGSYKNDKYEVFGNCTMREDDREKFLRLATRRVNSALKALQLIGNLSNRSNYDFTDDDVQKMFRAIQNELNVCRQKFQSAQRGKEGSSFSFD